MPICELGRFARPWPLLLFVVHLVERLADDVIFRPLDRRTPNHILRLRYSGKFVRVYTHRVLAPRHRLLAVTVTLDCVCETSERGGEHIVVRSCSLCALLLQGAHEAFRILDGGMLELLQGFQVALALLALDLQQRYRGSQGYGIWVLAL